MGTTAATRRADRVAERRRAVALACHLREAEGLSIAQIAERLGRAPATLKGYFYDPTGEMARAVKARYVGVCRGCGAYTQPRNGKGDAYDWSQTHARGRGGEAVARLAEGEWPPASVVTHLFGTWAPLARWLRSGSKRGRQVGADVLVNWQGIHSPAETPAIRRYIRGSERRWADIGTDRFAGISYDA